LNRPGSAFTVLRGLVYSACFVALWAWLAGYVRRFDDQLPFAIPVWLAPIGLGLAVAGGLVAAACIATFVTVGRGTPAPFDPPREFVASGPYRFVRNPMYAGAGAALLGVGLYLASPAIVLLTLGFLVTMHLFVVLYEEDALERRFGESYLRYRAGVHRWLVGRPYRSEPASSAPKLGLRP
jgi:protein-S-isoprenylcysteine O-methyltransferase Ste14